MFLNKHALFQVENLSDIVLDYLHSEQRCYWIRSALANNDLTTVAALLRHDPNVTAKTILVFAVLSNPSLFEMAMNQPLFRTLLRSKDFILEVWKQSSRRNFRLLLPDLEQILSKRDVMAFYIDSNLEHWKLTMLLDYNANLDLTQIFAGKIPHETKLWLLRQKPIWASRVAGVYLTFDTNPDLIRFCLEQPLVRRRISPRIAVNLRWQSRNAYKLSNQMLQLLRDAGCLPRENDIEYFTTAFHDGHVETAQFFYHSTFDLNVLFSDTPLQYPRIFEYFFPKCNATPQTCCLLLINVEPSCFHLTPRIFDILVTLMSNVILTDVNVWSIMNASVAHANIILLDHIMHRKRDLLKDWLENLIKRELPEKLPCASAKFLWTTCQHENLNCLLTPNSVYDQHQTLLFLLDRGTIDKEQVVSLARMPCHLDLLRELWQDSVIREKLHPANLLEAAIEQKYDSVVLFLLAQRITLPHAKLAKLGPHLCEMGLVGLLSNLTHIKEQLNCYLHMHKSLAMDVVSQLWRIAPLTSQQLCTNNLFWNIAKQNMDAALFIWQQNAFDRADFHLMTNNAVQYNHQRTNEVHAFLTLIHYDF